MKYIQCFGGIGANIVDVDPIWAKEHTTDFQTYVPYNESVHTSFCPRDRVTADGIDSSRRILLESSERDLEKAQDELELAENSLTSEDELDQKKRVVARAKKAVLEAEKQ